MLTIAGLLEQKYTNRSWSKEELPRAESETGKVPNMKLPCPQGRSIFFASVRDNRQRILNMGSSQ